MVALFRTLLILAAMMTGSFAAPSPSVILADRVYENGVIFTADSRHPKAQALGVKDGRIVYVGSNKGVAPFIGDSTSCIDLKGRFLMPGLVDGHMHPLGAGMQLLKANLNYESLTVTELQQRVQSMLDKTAVNEPDGWLEVVNWFQEIMRPAGVKTSRAVLDALNTKRPVILRSSYEHTVLANSRALELAGITASIPDPLGGKIWRDSQGNPTGLLEDAAFDVLNSLLPKETEEQRKSAAMAALHAMNAQGVTSFLDAAASRESLAAFTDVCKAGALTARAHFAPMIEPKEAGDPAAAVARVVELAKQYDQGEPTESPGVTVRNAKLFLDGVISAPSFTGAMMDPYMTNIGTTTKPKWVPGQNRGPEVYFKPELLAAMLVQLGRAGIDPHLHADGDGAVHAALNGIEALRNALPTADIRPAIAHNEIVQRTDFLRYKAVGAIPVLSFQWAMPGADAGLLNFKNYFGRARMDIFEPAGFLSAAGARIAFGSDWPVDPLDQWFAFQVAVTRRNNPALPGQSKSRLGKDRGLTRVEVLRSATINSAYELHADDTTGSLEVGKFADFIVLDRNPLNVSKFEISKVQVLQTVVGGKVVYEAR